MTADDVLAAVDAVMSRPFVWGPCDCCTAAADAYLRLWGVDPMAGRRGYRGRIAAGRMMRAAGGLARMAADQARAMGLQDGHRIGGLAVAVNGRSLLVCIQPGQWAGKTMTGFAIVRQAGQGWHA